MRETYLTSREQDYLKLEEELKQDEQKITKFNFGLTTNSLKIKNTNTLLLSLRL